MSLILFFLNPDFIDYRNKDMKNVPIVPVLIKGNKGCCVMWSDSLLFTYLL